LGEKIDTYLVWATYIILGIIGYFLLRGIIRFFFEIYYSKNIRYLKVTVPRADSKLDKEKETKKDFKEKIGMMTMFYKAIHKLSEAGLRDTFLNWIFKHSKISLELVYEDGEVTFFIVTYKSYVNLVSQHLTSIYTDAEVLVVDKKDYIKIKPSGYSMRAASLGKENDDVYPIKTYKYLEDDPLNNFSNVFGGLNKEDKAVFQMVIKPDFDHNKKALNAARLVAKGQYRKKRKSPIAFLGFLWNPIVAIFQGPDNMVSSGNGAPGASEGDAYKIFNQAETEAQKIMGEAAAQPAFKTSIRVLVSSKTHQNSEDGVHAIVAAASIFTDEYNNSLDNPQVLEDAFPWIFTP
ncbi:MAG: hypothetical protein GY828_05525, partial [Candidatus Gracilibacteria bacterium]|nr:hypothetical protein [Candidatus Gracilibacteria bacterium]